MEQSDSIGLAAAAPEEPAMAVERAPRTGRLGLLALVLAVGVSGLAVGFGVRLWQRLGRMEGAVSARADAVAAKVEEEVAALTRANEGLREEVKGLRSDIATSASEDVLFLKAIVLKPNIDPDLARIVARLVHKYAVRFNKDPNLVLAIIAVESDFNPQAVSRQGATGLMQVMPHWKKVLGFEEDLTDPETSIRYGLQVLGFYEQMYKDPEMVLTAYNRGPGPVDGALMRGASPDNGYSAKVLATYDRIRRLNTKPSLK
jgi:soluble lytic murein transglycosylase-like protein